MAAGEVPQRGDIVRLTSDLIRVPSVTGNQEAMTTVLDVVKAELAEFTCEEFVEPTTGTKSLLFYNTPTRPAKFRALLNGHVDVVSGSPEQFDPHEDGNNLIGRGASDMKGGAATEALVFKAVARLVPYPLALQIVTDEETGGFNGTGYQVKQGVRADLVISGESTELDINNERKGVLVLKATTHGKPAHAAYLYQGDNATVKAARLAVNLSQAFPIPANEDQWETTMNIAGIYTPNVEHNKVPDEASVLIDFRHIPADTKADLRRRVTELAPQDTELEEKVRGGASYADPHQPDLQLLAQHITAVTGKPANFIRKSGSSDSRHFAEVGSTAVDFGPRGSGLHTEYELGDIDSYEEYARILTAFLTNLT